MIWNQKEQTSSPVVDNQVNSESEAADVASKPAVPVQLKASGLADNDINSQDQTLNITKSESTQQTGNSPISYPAPPIQLKSAGIQRKPEDEDTMGGADQSSSGAASLEEEEI